jgi:predicted nucleotidyltransferase
MLDALRSGILDVLESNVVGVYACGSLVNGDFDPATSDLDLFVVTRGEVTPQVFRALEAMHARLETLPNAYANKVDLAYVPLADAQDFQPGKAHPCFEWGGGLHWKQLGANWLLECWTVRERGIALYGPDPKSLIAPIATQRLVAVVRERLADWLAYANAEDDPGWRSHMGEMRYVVETMCRALCTVSTHELPGKPGAVRWGRQTLPEPWRTLVTRSQSWMAGAPVDEAVRVEVRAFVRWTALHAASNSAATRPDR